MDQTQVSALEIAAVLAEVMTRKGQQQVAEEIGVSLDRLLDMIELKKNFNRRVLRYLGYRKKVFYVRDQ